MYASFTAQQKTETYIKYLQYVCEVHNPYKNKKQVAIYKYCYTLAQENVSTEYGFIASLNYSLYIL